MSLRSRINSLERLAEDARLSGEPGCATCGGPDRHGRQVLLVSLPEGVDLADEEKLALLPRCADCEWPLDEKGRAAAPHHRVVFLAPLGPDDRRFVEGPDGQLLVELPDGQLVVYET